MKKFFTIIIKLCLVFVPIVLLVWGIVMNTDPVWDLILGIGIGAYASFSCKEYVEASRGEIKTGDALALVTLYGICISLIILLVQALSCQLRGAETMPLECSIGWLFLVGSCVGFRQLAKEKYINKVTTLSVMLGLSFMLICVIGVAFDMFKQYTGIEIPAIVGNLFGILAPITGLGCLTFLIIGLIQDKLARR